MAGVTPFFSASHPALTLGRPSIAAYMACTSGPARPSKIPLYQFSPFPPAYAWNLWFVLPSLSPPWQKSAARPPVAVGPNAVQQVIIALPMFFEVEAQIQKRLSQHFLFAQNKRDGQLAQPSIATKKRMDGFKLNMDQGRF